MFSTQILAHGEPQGGLLCHQMESDSSIAELDCLLAYATS
jgi:hypothetical protein